MQLVNPENGQVVIDDHEVAGENPPDDEPVMLGTEIVTDQQLANIALQEYLQMGATRNVIALWRYYTQMQRENPKAFVPTTDRDRLYEWERKYQWKKLAYDWDAQEHNEFLTIQRQTMDNVYKTQYRFGCMMLRKAEKGLKKLNPKRMTPSDINKFVETGAKLKESAADKRMKLQDPRSTGVDAGGFFDQLRNMILTEGPSD